MFGFPTAVADYTSATFENDVIQIRWGNRENSIGDSDF